MNQESEINGILKAINHSIRETVEKRKRKIKRELGICSPSKYYRDIYMEVLKKEEKEE